VPESAAICPRCGDDIAARQTGADFTAKLIAALQHPEPMTQTRAAWILGQRRERKSVQPLLRLVVESADALIIEAAIEALGKIQDPRALRTLKEAACHPSRRVRSKAGWALKQLEETE